MKKWIRNARKIIARIPIWIVLSGYIVVILIFAYIYTLVPDGFYHQTISLEKGYEKEAAYFSETILKSIKNNFREMYESDIIYFDNIKIDINTLKADNSYVNNERVIVPMNLQVEVEENKGDSSADKGDCSGGSDVMYEDFFDISLSTNIIKLKDSIYVPLVITSNVFVDCSDIEVKKLNYNQLFKNKGFLSPVIKVNEDIEKDIDDFLLASKGFSSQIDSHFLSMLYLSSVTITTIGYGDIVPITWVTRMLITIEALLGMTLMGIYLNNITYKE